MPVHALSCSADRVLVQGQEHPRQLLGIRPDEIQVMKRADGSDWVLGSGGYGSVYKALMNGFDVVAVKVRLWSRWIIEAHPDSTLRHRPACEPRVAAFRELGPRALQRV